jgi:hypothetical protein
MNTNHPQPPKEKTWDSEFMKYLSPTDPPCASDYPTIPPPQFAKHEPYATLAQPLSNSTLPHQQKDKLYATPTQQLPNTTMYDPQKEKYLQETQLNFPNLLTMEKYFKVQESILLQLQQMQQQIKNLEEQMMQFSSRSFQFPKSTASVGTNTSSPLQSIFMRSHHVTPPHYAPNATPTLYLASPHHTTIRIRHHASLHNTAIHNKD